MHPSWGLCWPSHSHHSQQPSSRAEAHGVHGAHHAHAPRRSSQSRGGSRQQAARSKRTRAPHTRQPAAGGRCGIQYCLSDFQLPFTGSILAAVGSHIIVHCACKRQPQFASSKQQCIHSTASHQNPHKKRHFSLFSEALSEQSYNFRECEHFSFFDGPGTWQSSTWQSLCLSQSCFCERLRQHFPNQSRLSNSTRSKWSASRCLLRGYKRGFKPERI